MNYFSYAMVYSYELSIYHLRWEQLTWQRMFWLLANFNMSPRFLKYDVQYVIEDLHWKCCLLDFCALEFTSIT